MPVFKKVIIGELLERVVRRKCKDLALKRDGNGISLELPAGIDLQDQESGRYTVAALFLKASQALLSTLVLRAVPLSGERVRSALRVAERDLARAVDEGDAPAVADLRLLAALLAARDGRFEDALERYSEMARDDPSDPRPHLLSRLLCALVGNKEEHDKWLASSKRVAPESKVGQALKTLMRELVVAVVLGGAPADFDEGSTIHIHLVVYVAAKTVDTALVSALRSKSLSLMEHIEVRAVRAFLLYARMRSALKGIHGCRGATTTN